MSYRDQHRMSRTVRNSKDPRTASSQPPSGSKHTPDWAYSMTEEEYQKFEKDLRQNPLPPLPQRSNRRTNKQVTLSESPPPEEINDNDNNRNMDTTTTITNIDNTTTITNTISTPVTPTNTTTHIPITTSPFANVLSNMSSYKNNLIQRLLGQQGRAANTTQDNPNPTIIIRLKDFQ